MAFPSIRFLGFQISKEGLKITDDKVKLIQAMKAPSDKKSSQRFLGLAQFFSGLRAWLQSEDSFLRLNLKRDAKYNWTDKYQAEFDNIIHLLTNAPCLQPVSVNKDIYTDSSYAGTGYAVFQPSDDDPDKLRVVGYGGHALTSSHRSWSVLQMNYLQFIMPCVPTNHIVDIELSTYLAITYLQSTCAVWQLMEVLEKKD